MLALNAVVNIYLARSLRGYGATKKERLQQIITIAEALCRYAEKNVAKRAV